MQPILKSIENKYKGLVKVTFYDVWKDDAPAKKFGIRVIPTQVFLDVNGKELMRHEGFFPEEEIDKFLQSQQVNIPQY
jgi:thioredoxin 1